MTPDRWCLADRRLYLCTADRPDLERFVDACIRGGVDVVQLREKHLDDRALVERALVVQRVCAFHRTPFILNDRPDLAASIGADGVHVGQDDQTPIEARRLVGDEAIIGLSTHSPTEFDEPSAPWRRHPGDRVRPSPIQYISAGPVVPTPTKPGRPGHRSRLRRPGCGTGAVAGVDHRRGRPHLRTADGRCGGPALRGGPMADRGRRPG